MLIKTTRLHPGVPSQVYVAVTANVLPIEIVICFLALSLKGQWPSSPFLIICPWPLAVMTDPGPGERQRTVSAEYSTTVHIIL